MIRTLLNLFRPRRAGASTAGSREKALRLASICDRVAAGDLEARVVGLAPEDEFLPLGCAINHLLDVFDSYVRESAAGMNECAQGRFHRPILLRGMPGAVHNAAVVINRAALKMKHDSEEIRRREVERRQIVEDVNISIGAACEELSASASEILRQAKDSCGLASTVVQETGQATGAVEELGGLAEKINSVVKLITELAEATNMLALNAAIEAAHAGEQGRGFAVVAGGVKQLSRDTRDATTSITGQIAAIHDGVTRVNSAIGTIANSVDALNRNATSINSAVNEQVIATEEISRRVAEIVAAMGGASSRVDRSAPVEPATVMARRIHQGEAVLSA